MTSPRLWGGMLVAMPTAMPWLPLTSRFGKRAGSTVGLDLVAGVVVGEVDGVLVDAVEHLHGERGEAALGVAGRRRRRSRASRSCRGRRPAGGAGRSPGPCARARRRSTPSPWGWYLPITSPVTRAHFMCDRSGRAPELVHAAEDPAVHRLEAVARVGQGPGHDDRHGVVEEGALHLLLDLDGLDGGADAAARRRRRRRCRRSGGSGLTSDVEEPHVLGVVDDEAACGPRRRRP